MNDIQIQNLKQPLTPIIARAQLALNELAKDKPDMFTVRQALRIIEVQGQRQRAMLDQLTMEVRLEAIEAKTNYPEQEEQMIRPEGNIP